MNGSILRVAHTNLQYCTLSKPFEGSMITPCNCGRSTCLQFGKLKRRLLMSVSMYSLTLHVVSIASSEDVPWQRQHVVAYRIVQGPLLQMHGSLGLQAAAAHQQAAEQAESLGLRAAWSAPRPQVLSHSVPNSWLLGVPGSESRPGAEGEGLLEVRQNVCKQQISVDACEQLLLHSISGIQLGFLGKGWSFNRMLQYIFV